MPAGTQNASQHVIAKPIQCLRRQLLTKPIPCQGNKICISTCVVKPISCQRPHKRISTCFDQTYPKQARTKCNSTCVTKLMQYPLTHEKNVLTNLSNGGEYTICISTCVDQTDPMSAKTLNLC
jgi:hypothetical protein